MGDNLHVLRDEVEEHTQRRSEIETELNQDPHGNHSS